jgi:hypothetical protein
MNRDLVLTALVLGVCGTLAWLSGLWPSGRGDDLGGGELERLGWRRLWAPLLPAALALAVLVGWALQEPGQTDERLRPLALVVTIPVALVWLRATWRALRALRRPGPGLPAAAVGVLRPRVIVDPDLDRALDGAARAAVLAHERAHVRHRDPLRIWLAQLATDLQWPTGGAHRRLGAWLSALELARDEEARREGIRGEDLATAIVAAARFGGARGVPAAAPLTGSERSLVVRIHRLLIPLRPPRARAPSWRLRAALAAAVLASTWVGLAHGDAVIRALPFVFV